MYAEQREAPRSRPPEGKMMTLCKQNNPDSPGSYNLFDLSRGGFSFLVFSQSDYEKDDIIDVLGFDAQKFDSPMKAKVMSVREADEMGIQFKVGCKFLTDEEIAALAS
jgi:hypothetical protein